MSHRVLVVDDDPALALAINLRAHGWQVITAADGRSALEAAAEHESHYLRVYTAQLRRKPEDDPAHPRHIVTSAGLGYTLEP